MTTPGGAERREDTQPQSPVAVAPPLPNRRNSELVLLGFAAVITTVALLIVEANQESGLRMDLIQFMVGFIVLFGGAHLAVRRYAPYADPLLLPVVALLNGLGLVMIYRLDLSAHARPAGIVPGGNANQQMLWTLLGVLVFTAMLMVVHDHRMLARYGYVCGLAGLVLLAIPAVLPDSVAEQYGAKIWIRLPGFSIQPAEFSKILLLIFFASVLVTKRS
ncbi:MAG: FtsW/RodA/SpoVE family cell cycle protein, partial [Actinobacteria bacterium]|nr:FtsW/RodA/SpoVE family cell cycle protein [Actinomycetota bacterium]